MEKKRPRVFIGSSKEGIDLANAVFSELENISEPRVWDQDVFKPMKGTLEALLSEIRVFDWAVLICTPDDVRTSREKESIVPRDNVIFELGLFIGAIGIDRVFMICPKNDPIALPSDFMGITPLRYQHRSDNDYKAAVRSACVEVGSYIKKGIKPHGNFGEARDVLFWHSITNRQLYDVDVRGLITKSRKYIFISGVSLTYVIKHCADDLRDALVRGCEIKIVISDNSELARLFYSRFSNRLGEEHALTYERYNRFYDNLPEKEKKLFKVYFTNVTLSHSIGLYDDQLFVSEYCLDCDSSRCPSYRLTTESESYDVLKNEIKILLSESECRIGT